MLDLKALGLGARVAEWLEYLRRFRDMFSTAKNIYGNLVGIDLDSSSVLSVSLRNPFGSAYVSQTEMISLPAGAIADDVITDPATFSAAIKKIVEKIRIASVHAVIAMPGTKVIIKPIRLDVRLSDAEAEVRAWQEVRKIFPDIVKNLYLDFTQIEELGDDKSKKYFLILVAARKEDILPRVDQLQQAGLTTKIVDVDCYALERVYTLFASQLPENHDKKYTAVIDFNPHSILFLAMHKNSMIYHNRQPYPGDVLVPMVQRAMGLEVQLGKNNSTFLPVALGALTEDQQLQAVMMIRRILQSFYMENPGKMIEQVVMTGRCALLPELMQYIQKALDIPLIVGNPFVSIKMGEQVNVEHIVKLGPAFALSCGLAMRGVPVWK